MKKRTFLLNLFMAISVFAFVACNDDDTDYVQPTMTIEGADEFGARKLEFTNKAEAQQIEIAANNDWFIRIPESAESWLTVTPSEGKGSTEPITINVNVEANDKTKDREATLAFVCDKIEQKALLTVSQEKKYVLTAESNRSMINKWGGRLSYRSPPTPIGLTRSTTRARRGLRRTRLSRAAADSLSRRRSSTPRFAPRPSLSHAPSRRI